MNWLLSSFFMVATTLCTPYDDVQTPILGLLQATKNECLVAGYTINNPVLVDCLIELKNRGVNVAVITDTTQASGKNEVKAIDKLRRHSILVFIGRSRDHQLMHAKFIVSDGVASEDGSYNYTVSANHQDNIIHLNHDPVLAEQLRKYWFQIKEDLQ